MQANLTVLIVAADRKGRIMEMNHKKNHLSCIGVFFIMLLFAMCLTLNVFSGSSYHLYGLSDEAARIETWEITESIAASGDGDNTTNYKTSFLPLNHSSHETTTKNICTIHMSVAIPNGSVLPLFLIIVFSLFFRTLFILLPDGRTLMNQKVRLDN